MNKNIFTARLLLRAPRIEDADRLAALLNSEAIAKNLAHAPLPYTRDDVMGWLPRKIDNPVAAETSFVIEHGDDGIVGSVGYHRVGDEAEIGYWLAAPLWGKGLMTEAAAAALGWYFDATGAYQVISGYFSQNLASRAVQQKLGFVKTGMAKVQCLARKAEMELVETELTRAAFAALGGSR